MLFLWACGPATGEKRGVAGGVSSPLPVFLLWSVVFLSSLYLTFFFASARLGFIFEISVSSGYFIDERNATPPTNPRGE